MDGRMKMRESYLPVTIMAEEGVSVASGPQRSVRMCPDTGEWFVRITAIVVPDRLRKIHRGNRVY
jgi:hypothetical protein